MKKDVLEKLANLADTLDARGAHYEAEQVDLILKTAVTAEEMQGLVQEKAVLDREIGDLYIDAFLENAPSGSLGHLSTLLPALKILPLRFVLK